MNNKPTEGALDKVTIAFRCPLELKYKLLVKFGKNLDEDMTSIMIRAVDALTKDVQLTKDAVDRILDDEAEAYKKRMRARLLRKTKNGNE